MIRLGTVRDLKEIENSYDEHFQHEIDFTRYTLLKKGVYPTREDARKAIEAETLYVYEEDNKILASVIVDYAQPKEYANIKWQLDLEENQVMVVHLLMVRPGLKGKGIGNSMVKFAQTLATENHAKALRLDTGGDNIPARSLYEKNGFKIVAKAPKKVGDKIAHDNHLYMEKLL